MKISKQNKEEIANIPAELTIKTTQLKNSLNFYPQDGAFLIKDYEQIIMESSRCGRLLCNVTLTITVQKQLK